MLIDTLFRSAPLELTLSLSVSLLQLHMYPLHHTSIQLRIHLRYVAPVFLAITCANDSSGSTVPPTQVLLMAFRRPIKASSIKVCTATSRCMVMGSVCRSRLMSVTGEPTQMRRLAEDWLGWRQSLHPTRFFVICEVLVFYRVCSRVSWSHVMARREHSRESVSLRDVYYHEQRLKVQRTNRFRPK